MLMLLKMVIGQWVLSYYGGDKMAYLGLSELWCVDDEMVVCLACLGQIA